MSNGIGGDSLKDIIDCLRLRARDAGPEASKELLNAVDMLVSKAKRPVKKIPVSKVIIMRAEGPSHLCGIKHEFSSIKEANNFMRSAASSFPAPGGGYDKHDLRVEWADGNSYSSRLDAKQDFYRVDAEIVSAVNFWLCRCEWKPSEKMLAESPESVEYFRLLDAEYEYREVA